MNFSLEYSSSKRLHLTCSGEIIGAFIATLFRQTGEKKYGSFVTFSIFNTLIVRFMKELYKAETTEATGIADSEIIQRVLGGEKDLYAIIIRRYNQRLYRVGISIVNDETEVEDIMQVAYINAYENLQKFAFRSSFATWLTRIMINESLLRLKKRARSVTMTNDMMDWEINQHPALITPSRTDTMLDSELKQVIEKAIRDLPDKYRIVFVLREMEGMNIADTQHCLDISAVNVKVRLNRARALLRKSLSEHYRPEELLSFHLSRCDRVVDSVLGRIKPY
jgi:RNA polymerase sigma-70 factor (ECF subfamily)